MNCGQFKVASYQDPSYCQKDAFPITEPPTQIMLKILITGASTGIGAATALEMAENNEIFVHYNASRDEAELVAAGIRAKGGTPHLVQANLMDAV